MRGYPIVSFPTKPPLPSVCAQRMFSLLQGVSAPQPLQFCRFRDSFEDSKDSLLPKLICDGDHVPQPMHLTSGRPSGVFMVLGAPGRGQGLVGLPVSSIAGRPPIRESVSPARSALVG